MLTNPATVEHQPNRLSADRNQALTFVFPITYNEQRLVQLGSRWKSGTAPPLWARRARAK